MSEEEPGWSCQSYDLDDSWPALVSSDVTCLDFRVRALTLDSSSDEECEAVEDKNTVKKQVSCVVINSESDDENAHEKKKAKICEISSEAGSGRKCRPSKKRTSREKKQIETGKSVCKIPGCFLLDLDNSKQYSKKYFKQNKDELVQKIYKLFNRTIFDQKLPDNIEIIWNKKMLRTAGLCTTSERDHPRKERYAKIEISPKVCDSADRLRDTLIHEMCHAASWLLDGIRDSHGEAWKYYARKSNMVHPELPRVTRCHNYKINYRIHYECTQCKAQVGRYTKSLNTDRFICARCRGPLVMLPLTRKDGTPIEPHVRPFAKYVQENYRKVLRESAGGISHGEVMRKLSKDYVASKKKLNPLLKNRSRKTPHKK